MANVVSAEEMPLRKITILETNNRLDVLAIPDWVFNPLSTSDLKKLKRYLEEKGFNPKVGTEKEFVLAALTWVSRQWIHNGQTSPPKSFHALDILKEVHQKQARYRCVEYGMVLTECLQAYGFVSRIIGLRSMDVAYGGFGQGHVAMEVWLNELGKWIFLDPQFGVFLTTKSGDPPLNFFEIFQEKKAGRFEQLIVNTMVGSETFIQNEEGKVLYKNFLKNYFGHMAVTDLKKKEVASLFLESTTIPLTFQGTPLNNAVFTDRAELFYPEMNRVALCLTFRDGGANFRDLMKSLKIETDAAYIKNMPLFAPKPDFLVTIKSKSKIKESYQYREESTSDWRNLTGNTLKWSARNMTNRLEVRLVNEFGRPGPPTFIAVQYQ